MVQINGEAVDAAGKTLAEYLAQTDYDLRLIAVEHNEVIVPKARYAEIVLRDGDVVEVVRFMGGGCIQTKSKTERRNDCENRRQADHRRA